MRLRLRAFTVLAVLFAAQISVAASGYNAKDPNANEYSDFRIGIKTGQLCDRMEKKLREEEERKSSSGSQPLFHARGTDTAD